MKYALVNNEKREAEKGLLGICPSCSSELIARCGQVKVNHWSHKKAPLCDPWWENETEWHRSWKNLYPVDCQEVVLFDASTKEKHIADVQTKDGLVIEFQHSKLDPLERMSREKFYKKMVWVVDGTRLKGDYKRFLNGRSFINRTTKKNLYTVSNPAKCFPSDWLESKVLVAFDFKGTEVIRYANDFRYNIYILLPRNKNDIRLFLAVPRHKFIEMTKLGGLIRYYDEEKAKPNLPEKQPSIIQNKSISAYVYDPKKGKFALRQRF